ncbi:MAG: TIGR00730 family Rossman fold protein [Verrucomicrobia bacterium]|nr:MAG: TIGR00730 family Rossman fold protein [Verrucomicrobiota bacterium]
MARYKVTDPRMLKLAEEITSGRAVEFIAHILENVEKLGENNTGIADLKQIDTTLHEMREANEIFAKYRQRRKVAVFGSARVPCDSEEYRVAKEFGRHIADKKFMVITGGGDGVMGAAQEGAGAENSFGLNINLPFEQRANPTIDGDPKLISFKYFFTRKLSFVKETHAFVLLPGGFGTLDEGFECLTLMQTGKTSIVPLVLLDKPNGYYWEAWRRFLNNDLFASHLISESDFSLFRITHKIDEAVDEIVRFYRVFHSYRWVGKKMVIRIQYPLSASSLRHLNQQFAFILSEGEIRQTSALPEEQEDVTLLSLPRIVLTPHKNNFGGLRQLINAINSSETS